MHTTSWIVKSTAMVHRVPGSAGPHGMGSRIWSPRGARRAREARRARGARRAREGRKLSCGCFDFCLPGAPEHQNWSYTPKKRHQDIPSTNWEPNNITQKMGFGSYRSGSISRMGMMKKQHDKNYMQKAVSWIAPKSWNMIASKNTI